MQTKMKLISCLFGCLLATSLYAQTHGGHQTMTPATSSAATKEFEQAMDKMHGPMMEGIKAQDPDVAFVKGMIPHHEGAIDMARIVLKYGKDPEIRKLAEDIIKAQEGEIKWMNEWLKKHSQ